mgnify:CR=1 FL=1
MKSDSQKQSELKNEDRRRFMQVSAKFGLTAATVALVSGVIHSEEASAQVAKEEEERSKGAKYTMNLATAYVLTADRSYPIMQLDMKENVQNCTNGEVYVKLSPGGQLATGSALAQKVQAGTIQASQHSISNFAPFAPVVDLINIPYWCGENQKFVNLVNSDVWKKEVNPKVEEKGFKILWYVVIDPRVVATRKGIKGPIKTPEQMRGLKFRVPGSKILAQFYELLGANPTPVAWGETSSAIKQGVADALDPSVQALYVFGFRDIVDWVTFNGAVGDSQVYSCNLQWFRGLPKNVQEGIEFASEITMMQNLAKVPAARAFAMAEMKKSGVKFYVPTADEMKQWVAKAGAQLPAWDGMKKELAGSLELFDKFQTAANTQSRYIVHDLKA